MIDPITRTVLAFLFSTLVSTVSFAALTVTPSDVSAPLGSTNIQVPVLISGGDPITDLDGAVQILGGPQITAVSFSGTVWESAPGGFLSNTSGTLPGAVAEPFAVLLQLESVAGSGVLFTLTIDASGLPSGDYTIRLTGTPSGSTFLLNANDDSDNHLGATYQTGTLTIVDDPLTVWQNDNFGSDVNDPSLEASVWGENADPDQDGLTNLVEFFLGTDPNVFTSNPASSTTTGRPHAFVQTDGGSTYFAVGYTRRLNRGSVTGGAESSGDLVTFDTNNLLAARPAVSLPGGDFEYVVEHYNVAISPSNFSRFFLLTVFP